MQTTCKVLIVDDEPHVISALKRALVEEPYLVIGAGGGEEALRLLQEQPVQVVISDEMMPGMDGVEFLRQVKLGYPETIRIMLTGHASIQSTMQAVNCGEIYRFFTKPWEELQIKLAIRGALEKYELERENRRLLQTVRRQSQELKHLEQSFPGISALRRDARGAIRLETEVSDEEIARTIAECNALAP
ncbi:hypothetical protein GMLC_35720 [Geomonas limicola]|uniref:Response regulatory domain-containing protein n=1 Tax=Geomonas limicola TaxID=2740186 RepID=A0A6V8NEJ6_9BACT|nr:response regulator [Geomonas limicola]GFO69993.1 hypothetical protein GMLC_35720 [Geomonas limicola]